MRVCPVPQDTCIPLSYSAICSNSACAPMPQEKDMKKSRGLIRVSASGYVSLIQLFDPDKPEFISPKNQRFFSCLARQMSKGFVQAHKPAILPSPLAFRPESFRICQTIWLEPSGKQSRRCKQGQDKHFQRLLFEYVL